MPNFKRSGGGNSDKKYAKKDFGGRDYKRPPVMHKATCSECGKPCEVPFKPAGKKPIFCKNCFRRDDQAYVPRQYGKDPKSFENKSPDQYKAEFAVLNAKLDRILKALNG